MRRKLGIVKENIKVCVFDVDATPNSHLAKQCQQVLDKCDVPIKVIEKTGEAICNLLVKSNPFKLIFIS